MENASFPNKTRQFLSAIGRPMTEQIKKAERILSLIVQQTSQAEYDDVTVDRLIREYQRLVV